MKQRREAGENSIMRTFIVCSYFPLSINRMSKSRMMMRWAGHVAGMQEMINAYRISSFL
jgi:hypothetical protein